MAKYLVESYYNCSIKVSHFLDDISENNLKNLEKQEDGKFEIIGLPAGTYEVEAWHEKLGTQVSTVTVAADSNETVDFAFSR